MYGWLLAWWCNDGVFSVCVCVMFRSRSVCSGAVWRCGALACERKAPASIFQPFLFQSIIHWCAICCFLRLFINSHRPFQKQRSPEYHHPPHITSQNWVSSLYAFPTDFENFCCCPHVDLFLLRGIVKSVLCNSHTRHLSCSSVWRVRKVIPVMQNLLNSVTIYHLIKEIIFWT